MKLPVLVIAVLYTGLFISLSDQGHVDVYIDWITGKNNRSCWSTGNPCKTLDFACQGIQNNSQIVLLPGFQQLQYDTTLSYFENISIIGQKNSIVNCTDDAGIGLKFFNVTNLSIADLSFLHCGTLQESTSISYQNLSTTLRFRSAVYIINSTNIHISNTTFIKNLGIGIAMFDTAGEVIVEHSHFKLNMVPKKEQGTYPGGGGIYIEHTLCSPGSILQDECNFKDNPYVNNNSYTIKNCTFSNNTAKTLPHSTTTFLNKKGPTLQRLGRGGGISIALKGLASHNNFCIEYCDFTGNKGKIGGAIAIQIDDQANDNHVTISNVNMKYNQAEEGGGGIEFGFFNTDIVNNNSVVFDNCYFLENRAVYGGAVSFYSSRTRYSVMINNSIVFFNCQWVYNVADVGAAVVLFPEDWTLISDGYLPTPVFHNNEFTANRITTFGNDQISIANISKHILGGGIIYSDTVTFNISGKTTFQSNSGSSIHISAAQINVCPDTVLQFEGNYARRGAGLCLIGFAGLTAHRNATITFKDNNAQDIGGAVLYYTVDFLDFINSRRCFLRYSEIIPPNNWTAKFIFVNNSAEKYGHAIYATSLKPCARASVINGSTIYDLHNVFNWTSFEFTPPLYSKHILSTDPAELTLDSPGIYVSPGIASKLPITVKDDLEQDMETVLLARCENCSENAGIMNSYTYLSDKKIAFEGNDTRPLFISLDTTNNKPIGINIVVVLTQCPPGYFLNENNECVCSVSTGHQLPGIVACNETQHQGVMQVGYWAGCVNGSSGLLTTAQCPLGYCEYPNQQNGLVVLPPNCTFLEKTLCKPKNRRGWLCGECSEGFSVYYHSNRFKCGICPHPEYGWLFYILSELLPLTILFVVVIVLDINLTSGSATSFILFAQTLDFFEVTAFGSYKTPAAIEILSRFYWFIFGFFNLDFFKLDTFSFCLWKGATVLDVLAFKYVTTLYALLLVGILFLMMKYCRCNVLGRCPGRNERYGGYTVINGLTAFFIITYSQCAKVSFETLTRFSVNSNDPSFNNVNVVFLSGNTNFFSREHLKYAIPAVVVIMYTALVPLVLLFHPLYFMFKKGLLSKGIINESVAVYDARRKYCRSCWPSFNLYLKPILDAFQGSYKDNSRFFAGLLFLYRLIIAASFAFSVSAVQMYFLLEVVVVIMLMVHSIFQPYHKRSHNIVDSLIFSDLALINGFSLFNYASIQLGTKQHFEVFAAIQLVLIYIPIIYIFILLILKLLWCYKPMRKKLQPLNQYISIFNQYQQETDEQQHLLDEDEEERWDNFDADHLPARLFEEGNHEIEEPIRNPIGVINGERVRFGHRGRRQQIYGSLRNERTTL